MMVLEWRENQYRDACSVGGIVGLGVLSGMEIHPLRTQARKTKVKSHPRPNRFNKAAFMLNVPAPDLHWSSSSSGIFGAWT
jgi:hypothetical protein